MAAVAQSKRDAEAAMIRAAADKEAAKLITEAPAMLKDTPTALDLKWMDTLKAVAEPFIRQTPCTNESMST